MTDKQMFLPGGGQDRVFRVSSFQISGPFDPSGLSATPSRERIFSCHPTAGDEQQRCAETDHHDDRHARVPPAVERDGLTRIASVLPRGVESRRFRGRDPQRAHGHSGESRSSVSRRTIAAKPGGRRAYRVDDLELASKLSFFLWNTMPDDELLELAVRGELHTIRSAREQVARMLADERAETLASNFVYQWLDTGAFGRDRARPSRLSVCLWSRRSAPRLRHGNHAVCEEYFRRGPQRRRPLDRGPHLRERARWRCITASAA